MKTWKIKFMIHESDFQQVYISRPQSPEIENLMSEALHDVLKGLLSDAYLYQNRAIDLGIITAKADEVYSSEALADEFTHRPWIPYSKNRGFTAIERRFTSSRPSDPLTIPLREMHLQFVIPTIVTWCSNCRSAELHDSIPHLALSPYHINPEAIAEPLGYQTLLFNFQCHKCKSPPITFMVRRELLKLQLCGRSKPYFPVVPREIPRTLREIYAASIGAAVCDDLRVLSSSHLAGASHEEHLQRGD